MTRAVNSYEPMPLLHIYGQAYWHQELLIIANRQGLEALRAAVDRALEATLDNEHQAIVKGPEPGPSARDGEHYDVVIWRDDTDWNSDSWQSRGFPYTTIDYMDCSVPELPAYPLDNHENTLS